MKSILTLVAFSFSIYFSMAQPYIPFFEEGRWGFMDTSGKTVITPQYKQTSYFSENRAAVVTDKGVGYIDETGTMVIEDLYESGLDFHNGVVSVYSEEDWMVLDKDGNMLFEAYFASPLKFNDGLARIKQEAGLFSRYGFINQKGDTVIPPQFELASNFSGGLCMASPNGSNYGYINTKGEWVILPDYEVGVLTKINGEYDLSDLDFSEGFAKFNKDNKAGLINTEGKQIISPTFEDVGKFSEGMAPAKLDGKYGFIDQNGKWLINPQFTLAEHFNEGVAAVALGDFFDAKWALIDETGKILFEPFILASVDFTSPLVFHNGYLTCLIDSRVFGYVGRDGKIIWKMEY